MLNTVNFLYFQILVLNNRENLESWEILTDPVRKAQNITASTATVHCRDNRPLFSGGGAGERRVTGGKNERKINNTGI